MPHNLLQSLEYTDGEWEAEVAFPILGDDILLVIDANELNGPSDAQKKQLNWLYENIESLFPKVEKSIFNYYQEKFDIYREGLAEHADEFMPKLETQSEVWSHVFEPGIYISFDDDNEIHLEFECCFDEENGLRVIIKDGEIQQVCL